MERVGFFLAGFASGWAVRTTVDSSRSLAVNLISTFYGVVDRASRVVGMEREHLEDLLAEARAKYEMDRARAARRGQATQPSQDGATSGPPAQPGSQARPAPRAPAEANGAPRQGRAA